MLSAPPEEVVEVWIGSVLVEDVPGKGGVVIESELWERNDAPVDDDRVTPPASVEEADTDDGAYTWSVSQSKTSMYMQQSYASRTTSKH